MTSRYRRERAARLGIPVDPPLGPQVTFERFDEWFAALGRATERPELKPDRYWLTKKARAKVLRSRKAKHVIHSR